MVEHFSKYKDKHAGQKLVVVGNGFSLADVPVEWLNSHTTIAMNSFYKLPGLCPDYWALEGAGHLKKEKDRETRYPHMDKAGLVLVNRRFVQYFEHFSNVRSVDYIDYRGSKKTDFSYSPLEIHGTTNSVMFFCLQLAYYLGGNPTLVVGLDHRFDGEKYHFYDEEGDFHVGPEGDFSAWADRAEESYKLCANVFKAHNRTLLNLTPGTACKAIPLGNLEDWA